MNNQTYLLCKTVITKQKAAGTLNAEDMMKKLDVFLMGDRISIDQYNELMALMSAA